jgi:hypothetical protein
MMYRRYESALPTHTRAVTVPLGEGRKSTACWTTWDEGTNEYWPSINSYYSLKVLWEKIGMHPLMITLLPNEFNRAIHVPLYFHKKTQWGKLEILIYTCVNIVSLKIFTKKTPWEKLIKKKSTM